MYMFTWLRNVFMVIVCANSPNCAERYRRNDGNAAPSNVKRNIFDLLSFKNSISMKLYILSPYAVILISGLIILVK